MVSRDFDDIDSDHHATSYDIGSIIGSQEEAPIEQVEEVTRRRIKVLSIFTCLLEQSRRMKQRITFRNRWKKQGRVKFDPKFHFIISQLIIKDIVNADGIIYPDLPCSSSSKKKSSKQNKKSSSKTLLVEETPNEILERKNVKNNKDTAADEQINEDDSNGSILSSTPNSSFSKSEDVMINPPQSISSSASSSLCQKHVSRTNTKEIVTSSQRCLDCTDRCAICWEGYKVGEKVCWSKNKNCTHAFHFDCGVTWLINHDHCPMCRSIYLNEEKQKKKNDDEEEHRDNSSMRGNTILRRIRLARSAGRHDVTRRREG